MCEIKLKCIQLGLALLPVEKIKIIFSGVDLHFRRSSGFRSRSAEDLNQTHFGSARFLTSSICTLEDRAGQFICDKNIFCVGNGSE